MLESIHIESYRTLRHTSATFREGLNIIIGQNGVGKSNLLRFVSTYAKLPSFVHPVSRRMKSLRGGYNYRLSNRDKTSYCNITVNRIKANVPNEDEVDYEMYITLINDNVVIEQDSDISAIDRKKRMDYRPMIRRLNPFANTYVKFNVPNGLLYLDSPQALEIDEDGDIINDEISEIRLFNHFEFILDAARLTLENDESTNVGSVIEAVAKAFRDAIRDSNLNEILESATNIQEVRLNPNINVYKKGDSYLVENLILEFLIDGGWMPWSYLSDGTKRSFFLIVQVVQAHNELVLIEEPEIGLHPFQLQKVMTFLKEQSATKQIILSTHSPEVLNILGPDELDQILIASINKGTTSFRRLSEKQKEKARAYMSEVGDLSYYWLHSDLEESND